MCMEICSCSQIRILEDEREKWTAYNCRYFCSSGIQMISLILTVLTNQFIKIVNVIQSRLVQY